MHNAAFHWAVWLRAEEHAAITGAFVALVTAGSVAAAFIFQKQRKLRMLSHLLRAVPSLLLVWDPAGCRERKVLALSPSRQQLLPVLTAIDVPLYRAS